MEQQIIETLGGLIIISGLVAIVYFISRYTYLIKKMLAEKGILQPGAESKITKLDVAYVIIGIGVGLLISAGLAELDLYQSTFDLLMWGIILISGSIGLLIANKQKK